MTSGAALRVSGLGVQLAGGEPIVEDLSLEVQPGSILGLVGESGSGKTTTALALLGFSRPAAHVVGGTVEVAGELLSGRSERDARRLRGRVVSYVPQDPANALNPALRIGRAIEDMLDAHASAGVGGSTPASALAGVHLQSDEAFRSRYPHQLSGGQQQRVTIAIALVCEPPVVVLDEPTTGLDVVTQARVLEEIDRLRRERGIAMVYVTHDLAVVAQVADRIAVMYAGRVVEEGPAEAVLTAPRHPYTRGLVASIPSHAAPRRLQSMPGVAVGVGERPAGCAFAPRCAQRGARCDQELPPLDAVEPGRLVRCFEWTRTPPLALSGARARRGAPRVELPLLAVEGLRAEYGRGSAAVVAADGVSFTLARAECLALVGESGSGKTTIARCVAGLHAPVAGRISLDSVDLAGRARRRPTDARRRIQIVFQNPYDSLNPRHRVADSIAWPARQLRGLSRGQARAEATGLLEQVRLPARIASRFPGELSGGERQRVAIARALAAKPDVLVCDEITSALDVSVQAAVLEVLAELRAELGLALLLITHDLGVVASVADRVIVLEGGAVCEEGPVEQILASPAHEYTRRLIESAPALPEAAGA